MLVATPLCCAQELTNVQLATDIQGHAQMHHACIHTNHTVWGRTHCRLVPDLQRCQLETNMLLLCRVMSEADKVLRSSEASNRGWLP